MQKQAQRAYRGQIFTFNESATLENVPRKKNEPAHHYLYIADGLLVVGADGKILDIGDYADLKQRYADIPVVNFQNKLITPGFIDTHIHATQTGAVAAYGEKLLNWLTNYVFPVESSYQDLEIARQDSNIFINELLKNGTTTACAYGPLFYDAANVLFEELQKRNMRFIAGNVMMDSNPNNSYKLTAQENYDNSKKLIEQWHDKDRLSFCLTPRFALSCSPELLELCGDLKKQHPSVYLQTHLSENLDEIKAVKELFPNSKNYLDVYDQFGLVDDKSIFGHCIHLEDPELELFKESQAIIAWCPTSNNFLGSGLFDFEGVYDYSHNITLATDMGAGNTFSMLRVLDDAYKVALLKSFKMPSMVRWYLATLGSARALKIADKIGTLTVGKEADFIVIDPYATELTAYRSNQVDDIFEQLFILMSLADDRHIAATYINGICAHERI